MLPLMLMMMIIIIKIIYFVKRMMKKITICAQAVIKTLLLTLRTMWTNDLYQLCQEKELSNMWMYPITQRLI